MQRETVFNRAGILVNIVRLALLVTLALFIPSLGMPQAVTGVLVNALLLLTVEYVGVREATLVGLVTPLSAALRGVLPLPLLAMIPFIAMGNAVLVHSYDALRHKNQPLALVLAAVLKFVLLYGAVTLLMTWPLSVSTANGPLSAAPTAALAQMMQWPQLATALGGGLLAMGVRLGVAQLAKRRS